jgi:hypothetical protein
VEIISQFAEEIFYLNHEIWESKEYKQNNDLVKLVEGTYNIKLEEKEGDQ